MVVKKTKKYRIEAEGGLIDNCKYMLYLSAGWTLAGGEDCMPCKSIKEAMEFVKEASFDSDFESVVDFANFEFSAFIDNYTICDELAYDEFSDSQKEFFEEVIKDMRRKCIKLIDKESIAFKKRIKKK